MKLWADGLTIWLWNETPQAQGSKSGFVRNGRVILAEANKKLKPWRSKVTLAAQEKMYQEGLPMIEDGPVLLWCGFFFERPKSHLTSKGEVKLIHRTRGFKSSKPDLDKLVRAVCDSLTGVVVKDDAQFVDISACKMYADRAGVVIHVKTG